MEICNSLITEITPQDFFINKGLYEMYNYDHTIIKEAMLLVYYTGSLDCYCLECGQHSIFNAMPERSSSYLVTNPEEESLVYGLKNSQTIQRRFTCGRESAHKLYFTVLLDRGTLSKIGQYPSYADISIQDIEKFNKMLPKELFSEFKKSIGLYAHSIGAGSVVYLRRIIEKHMIEPAYQKAKLDADWREDEYLKARMSERMKLLSVYLPPYLVNNSIIYGVVSKGIHELSEKECLEYFPVLKSFIEVVLTDIKNKKDEEETRKNLSNALSLIASKI